MWISLLLLACTVTLSSGRLAEELEQTEDPCKNVKLSRYHKPQEECLPLGQEKCRCKIDKCKEALLCCDVNYYKLVESLGCANTTNFTSIHIRNATLDVLNLTQFISWRWLKSMSITDGKINTVVGNFGFLAKLEFLNFSSNGIINIEERSLALPKLKYLDLSHNNLSDVPGLRKINMILDISDNKPIICSKLYDAFKKPELEIKNPNNTWCIFESDFNWFNSTNIWSLMELESYHEAKKGCIKHCTCETLRFQIYDSKSRIALLVNCFDQQLTELPTPLPPNTIALNVSNNNIISLTPVQDPSYDSLQQLYADNNQIESIVPLEGTHFISHFKKLSLKHNKLKSIPTYILANIFDRNIISRQVYLGHNKLTCDCDTAKVLKEWLKQKRIIDYNEIECEGMDVKVVQLDETKLCQSPQDWTDYIYYIITAEVFLLVFLIVKVSYDYWVFKTVGYLPWPASKMPKLPCDWLCE